MILIMMAGAAGLSALSPNAAGARAETPERGELAPVPASRRDMPLPAWGPYSPSLYGLSHIADAERGFFWSQLDSGELAILALTSVCEDDGYHYLCEAGTSCVDDDGGYSCIE